MANGKVYKMARNFTSKGGIASAIAFAVLIACGFATSSADNQRASEGPEWTWSCDAAVGLCRRSEIAPGVVEGLGLEACRLTCGPGGALWPIPTGSISLGDRLMALNPDTVTFTYAGPSQAVARLLADAVKVFQWNLKALARAHASSRARNNNKGPRQWKSSSDLSIVFSIASSATRRGSEDDEDEDETLLTWDTDEGYSLEVGSAPEGYLDAFVNATTFYGARHALETLSQLVAWDTHSKSVVMAADARILNDKPVYPHRGLLLDPARNFLPMSALYRQVDAMASCKMNVLHLHLTDTQSFPYVSKSVPVLSDFGALPGMSYSPDSIASLVHYARIRGVRVLPEFDAPAHAGAGWDAASERLGLGNLAVCVRQQPWRALCIEPPCGQLNPVNGNLYPLLGRIYADMVEDFGIRERPRGGNDTSATATGPLVHMGGDEVHMGCWNNSAEIVEWMEAHGYPRTKEGFVGLWANFQAGALAMLDGVQSTPATAILWTSDLTNSDDVEAYLDKSRYVIQAWMPAAETLPVELLNKGYRVIFSTKDAWYLDHGYGNWKGSSTSGYPFHPWQVCYDNALPPRRWGRNGGEVLGGEVATWGEMVDDVTLDAKTWPRAAAAAERLWSNPLGARGGKGSWLRARHRMMAHRERMVARGIGADALQPKWCYFNEGECE